mgnify:FL=1
MSVFSGIFRSVTNVLTRWFPLPKTLLPTAVGVDISDTSIKWIVLEESVKGKRVRSFGQEFLPGGTVVNGVVQDVSALAQSLSEMKKKLGGI